MRKEFAKVVDEFVKFVIVVDMGRTSDAKLKLMQVVVELIWTGSYGSTTIDDICEKAQVKRGSFYYFFDSKADLAVVAIDEEWQRHRPDLDAIFSPVVPPLERLKRYCEYGYRLQSEWKAKCGHVLGCSLFTLGSEVSTQEVQLTKKVQEILDQKRKYLESAIRDAHAAGVIHAPDAAAKARTLFTYYEGQLTEARIQNNLDHLRDAIRGTYELLGIKEPAVAAAG
jgi:TetR/AcrR family transcriptional regulator, transcriptional repressor for nem operon